MPVAGQDRPAARGRVRADRPGVGAEAALPVVAQAALQAIEAIVEAAEHLSGHPGVGGEAPVLGRRGGPGGGGGGPTLGGADGVNRLNTKPDVIDDARPAKVTQGRLSVEARQGRGGVGAADVAGLKAQLIDQRGADPGHRAPVKRQHQHPGLFSAQEVACQLQLARRVQLTGLHGEDVGVHALGEGVKLHHLLGGEAGQQRVGHERHAHDAALHVGLQRRVAEQLRDRA